MPLPPLHRIPLVCLALISLASAPVPALPPVETAATENQALLGAATAGEELLVLRVGLATDLHSFSLPCCDPRVTVTAGDESWTAEVPATVRPATDITGHAFYRLRVAALKDERQAAGIAEYLKRFTGKRADAVFDAGSDLYKVRCGDFATSDKAEALRGPLEWATREDRIEVQAPRLAPVDVVILRYR